MSGDRVYCHGDLVATRIVDGWYVCSGCGHDLWPIDATFAIDPDGLASDHADKDDTQTKEEGDADARGAVQA